MKKSAQAGDASEDRCVGDGCSWTRLDKINDSICAKYKLGSQVWVARNGSAGVLKVTTEGTKVPGGIPYEKTTIVCPNVYRGSYRGYEEVECVGPNGTVKHEIIRAEFISHTPCAPDKGISEAEEGEYVRSSFSNRR